MVHDWDDERSLALLGTCRRAIPPHGRLQLVALLLPVEYEPALEKVMVDVTMLARVGGRERTEAEYRALLEGAGFRVARVVPTGSLFSLLECVPV